MAYHQKFGSLDCWRAVEVPKFESLGVGGGICWRLRTTLICKFGGTNLASLEMWEFGGVGG